MLPTGQALWQYMYLSIEDVPRGTRLRVLLLAATEVSNFYDRMDRRPGRGGWLLDKVNRDD